MLKRLLRPLLLALAIVAGVVLFRARDFRSKQVSVASAELPTVDGQAAAERLAGALRFRTISNQDPAALDAAAFEGLRHYLEEQFPLVHAQLRHEVVNGHSLLYTWTGSKPELAPVLLLAHQDVVPVEPGTEGKWSYPPFGGRIADGFVWGRGALDDKLSLLGILEAVELLLKGGFHPTRTFYLAFGYDEEIGGEQGAAHLAALLQSRRVHPGYVLDEGGAIVQGGVPGVAVPVALIGIAEKGNVSVELTVRAEGGHSSAPPAHTAIGALSTAIHRLERHQMPTHLRGGTRELFEYVGPEMSFGYRMLFANMWLFGGLVRYELAGTPATNATLRTTTAATMINGGIKENVLPSSATAVVNFRILPGDTIQSVVQHVRDVVDDPTIALRTLDGAQEPTGESPTGAPSFSLLQRTISQVFPDVIVSPYLTPGGTDARNYTGLTSNIYRFIPFLADRSDLARMHGTNERVSIDNYERGIRFYAQLIRNSGSVHR